ncbi:Hypothetical protein GLP15_4441 [Giardia lamblia P15]|uniref:Uncharacterized protein n=1 Tax=Giardia intestinalis (strain P15) TaxID=658858 RepID=E1F5K8_GIAIA|nr:Hypothetical protein GLP15_4441 [Giardia lamblia P15]
MNRIGQAPAPYFWGHVPRAYHQANLFVCIQQQHGSLHSNIDIELSGTEHDTTLSNVYCYRTIHEPHVKRSLPRYFLYCIESPFCLRTGSLPM